ncbi:MAG: hypothetical protein IPH06_06110 [Alphaproteobacteria bacterium]|nr:hypothetical protein [Alphaproteobacteria bacterium]QQS57594.1 MAG: hypothetical protein IPN28_01875 [Alphaproteobacteria bacterium]
MSGKSFRNWAAGLTIAAAASYMLVSGDPQTEDGLSETPAAVTPAKQTPPVPQANAFPPPLPGRDETATAEKKVEKAWSQASKPPQTAAKDQPSWVAQARAKNFYEKFKRENDFAKKLEYLDYIFDALNSDIKNASILGLKPEELASTIRNTAHRAFQDLSYRQSPETALDQLFLANDMRIAHRLSGLKDDGSFDETYAEQITGISYDAVNSRKKEVAVPAAGEALAQLRNLEHQALVAPQALHSLTDEQIQEYFTRFNLVQYVLESYDLDEQLIQNHGTSNKFTALNLNRTQWQDLLDNLGESLFNVEKERLRRQFGNPLLAPEPGN